MKQINVTDEQLNKYASEHSWHKQMSESRGLDSYDNYSGAGLGDAVVVLGRSRDSELLDESNFSAALDMLGGESATVEVHRFGHWACGWYELITVDPSDRSKLLIAYQIKQSMGHYPVLDEDDYYERQSESYREYAEGEQSSVACAIVKHLGLPDELAEDDDMLSLAYWLNVECQQQNGEDSAINLNEYSDEPDDYAFDQLISVLESLGDMVGIEANPAYQYMCAALGLDGGAQ